MCFLQKAARCILTLLVFLVRQEIGQAGAVSLHPIADTTITQKTSLMANTLVVGTNNKSQSSRALLQFDIAGSIPTNATITSAALTVTVVMAPPSPVNSTFDLRALLLPWSESDATWTNRLNSTPWSTPGGAAGLDYSINISQTNFFGSTTGLYTFVSNSSLVANVQNWLQNPGTNFGWIVISESQGVNSTERTLASREVTANAPTLLVQFTLPAVPPIITSFPLTDDLFQFSFNAESNRTYAVQYISDLLNTNWSVLTNFDASPILTNFIVSDPLTSSNRFYRVQTP